MVYFLLTFLLFLLFAFVNTLFYSIGLLAISICLLFIISLSHQIRTLTVLMLLIVYVGAIIVLIGYVCAISPNLIVTQSLSVYLGVVLSILSILFGDKLWVLPSLFSYAPLSSFFYSSYGLVLFVLIALMLFVTLLIVTSQYLSPKGPFRALAL